ncbi:MAG TPA: GDSL-type esterase/lipase family protein [Myxococcaceae bacterium]|nr:GDSL-type esterase/lipase family protein [Myxococcaceae bacterium]
MKNPVSVTGKTLLWVAALAVLLSLAPLPEALRPFPALASEPGKTVASLTLPPRVLKAFESPRRPEPPMLAGAPAGVEAADPDALDVEDTGTWVTRDRPADAIAGLAGGPQEASARDLEALGAELGVRHMPIEPGCRKRDAEGTCTEEALAPFFEALRALGDGEAEAPVRALHLGDSLIASDHITDIIRERLQARHGDGGPGWLFVDRPTRGAGRKVRTGEATDGWKIEKITEATWPKGVIGLSGVIYTGARGQTSAFQARGAQAAEVWFRTRSGGGALELRADGQQVGRIISDFPDDAPAQARVELPAGTKTFSIAATDREVQVYGVSLEHTKPGLVYDSIGLPGSTATVLMRPDAATFKHQLRQRDPSLIVLMLGGNEAFELSRKRTDFDTIRKDFRTLITHLRGLEPDAACLVSGTLDAGVRTMSRDVVPRAGSREISDIIREVALAEGCAYWDALDAMGGVGVTKTWLERKLMHEDLVHPRARGADLIGHLFDIALQRAYLRWQGPQRVESGEPLVMEDPRGLEGAEHLAGLKSKLDALKSGARSRVAFAQLGASHTAAHFFTDAMRARLAAEYGGRGRGYVAAGRPTKRFPADEVVRDLKGKWAVLDAIQDQDPTDLTGRSRIWGANGVRTVLEANAVTSWSFCAGCTDREARARLTLHFLETPDMGEPEILLDGKAISLPPLAGDAPGTGDARTRVVSWEQEGPAHTLEVRNRGPGPLTVFGASSELLRPGIVYDSLGLPTATVFDLEKFDRHAFHAQFQALAPDLVLFFYGTNEAALPELDVEALRRSYDEVFKRLRAASPGVACAFIGPTDRMEEAPDGSGWVTAPSMDASVAGVRQVAREQGCAFWSARAEMGGEGSIEKWLHTTPRLAHPDHVHLSQAGYEKLANAFADALVDALNEGG